MFLAQFKVSDSKSQKYSSPNGNYIGHNWYWIFQPGINKPKSSSALVFRGFLIRTRPNPRNSFKIFSLITDVSALKTCYKFYIEVYVLTAIMPDREISLPVVHHFNQSLNSLEDGKQRFLSRRNRKTKYFSNRGNKARRILERMREVITGMML